MKQLFTKLLRRATRQYIRRHRPYLIGVTGSVGKTTCRMTVARVLEQLLPDLRISTSPKNFNTDVGLCLSILEIERFEPDGLSAFVTLLKAFGRGLLGGKRYDVAVLEYGIDSVGDMDWLLSIAKPEMSIFTSLDLVHAEQMGSPDEILAEKAKLLLDTREIMFINAAATYLTEPLQESSIDQLTYALDGQTEADVSRSNHTLSATDHGPVMAEFSLDQEHDQVGQVRTNLLGHEHAGYISLGVEIAMILERRLSATMISTTPLVCEFELQPGRFTILQGKMGSVLIDSTYNAAPQSMLLTIENTIRLRQQLYTDKDLIYCLGDMRELGDYAEEAHRKLAARIAQSADAVYLVGDWMSTVLADELHKLGYNMSDIHTYTDSVTLGKQLLHDVEYRQQTSLILFKGSQNTIFLEEAVKQLLYDPADEKKLCRQSKWWLKKKRLSVNHNE